MSRLEKHFLTAFGYQQLGCILLCLSVLGHSIQPIFQNRDRKGAGRIGEAGRQWNGLDRKHFSGTRPETAPGENHHAPGGLASRSRSVPLVLPQRAPAQPRAHDRFPPRLFFSPGVRRWGLTATSTLCFCPRNW